MIEFKNGSIGLSDDGRRSLSVSLRLRTGDLAVLVGPNGSGKTTLLDVVAGVRKLNRGTLAVAPPDTPIAYVVQDAASGLLPWRTILSNILLPAYLHNDSSDELLKRATALLASFGLAERKQDFPYRLSGGEKQLANLVRAVCTPASLVLLDEPFSSLNTIARAPAKALLLNFALGRTTFFVTHDPADLDWPITRFIRIVGTEVIEVDPSEARRCLENAIPATSS